ncbi:hypothetical protein, partial [Thalassotalea sp. PP2-459]|uniref:hypothetical protein n=1 Tax=Thalassotalea sp. PP2-459 TaxID=1742724 RepID=UPI000A5C3CEB
RIKRFRGTALIAENGYSGERAPAFSNKLHPCSVLFKINNTGYEAFKLALWGRVRGAIIAQNVFDVEQLYLHTFRLFSHL